MNGHLRKGCLAAARVLRLKLWAALCKARARKSHGYKFLLTVWLMNAYVKAARLLAHKQAGCTRNRKATPSKVITFQEIATKAKVGEPMAERSATSAGRLTRSDPVRSTKSASDLLLLSASEQGCTLLSDARLLDGGNSIVHQGLFIRGRWRERKNGITEIETEPEFHAHAQKILDGTNPEPSTIQGLSLCVAGPWSDNYFHWLIQYLPILKIASQWQPLSTIDHFLVRGPVKDFQREALARFDIPAHKGIGINKGQVYIIEDLLLTSIPCDNFTYDPWVIRMLRELTESGSRKGRPTSLYFDRRAPTPRRIVNMAEISDLLENYGIQSIDCSRISFQEQINLASSSSLLIGVHGASLANSVFSAPGTVLIELLPRNYRPRYFSELASACQLQHLKLSGVEPGPLPLQQPIYNADIIVPTRRLKMMLENLATDRAR